jgi:hypothetical protein
MNLKAATTLLLSAALVIAGSCREASAGYFKAHPIECSVIQPASGNDCARILVKFNLPDRATNAEIDYAELVLSAEVQHEPSAPAGIVAARLNRGWSEGTVEWGFPWITPGGDFSGTTSAAEIVNARDADKGAVRIAVDVTDIVQYWALHPGENYGLAATSGDHDVRLSASPADDPCDTMTLRVFFTDARCN